MTNEIIPVSIALIDLAFVVFALRFGVAGLTGILIANIILVSTLGAKLIAAFGLVSNAGNVFYAAAFFASVMIAEHYGKKAAHNSVWIGFVALVLYVLMGQFILKSGGKLWFESIENQGATFYVSLPLKAEAARLS